MCCSVEISDWNWYYNVRLLGEYYKESPRSEGYRYFKDCILGFETPSERDKHYTEGPGMYKVLYPIGLPSCSMQCYIY